MNFSKFILSMSVACIFFLGACSDDSSAGPVSTSKGADEESVDEDGSDAKSSSSKAKSSSSVKKESKDTKSSASTKDDDSNAKSSSSKTKSSSSEKKESKDTKSSASTKDDDSNTKSSSSKAKSSASSAGSFSGDVIWGECTSNVKNNITSTGSEVTWTIKPKKVGPIVDFSVLSTLTYKWNFEGGIPSTVSDTLRTATTKYENSGTFATSVTMTIGSGESQVVQCPSIDVTGGAVTGCTCKAAKPAADISEGVSWTVSGCISEDQNFTYTWSEPFQSETTAVLSGSVAAKGLYKPTVRVKNGANGLMDVTCDEIAVSDKNIPDYIIKAVLDDGAIKLPAGKTSVSLEVDPFNKTVFCTVARVDSPSGAVNGTVNGVKLAGADYVAVPVPNLAKGSMINFELDVPATCGVH